MNRRDFTRLSLMGGGMLSFLQLADAVQAVESQKNASAAAQQTTNTDSNTQTDSSKTATANAEKTDPAYAAKKAEANKISHDAHMKIMEAEGVKMMGEEKIAMLLYPQFTALDLVGPQFLFASMMGAQVHIVSPNNTLKPVTSDTGLEIMPTVTMNDCPDKLDLLFIPGSASGVVTAMRDKPLIDFIRQKATATQYLTSVCTGSMLLGKAGLLKGKNATSHWITLELLRKFGATPVKKRVVWDGNLITGGGVTAGIDFGLEILAALRGETYAKAIQLQLEYDPQPPFSSGSPDDADPFITQSLQGMFAPLLVDVENAISS